MATTAVAAEGDRATRCAGSLLFTAVRCRSDPRHAERRGDAGATAHPPPGRVGHRTAAGLHDRASSRLRVDVGPTQVGQSSEAHGPAGRWVPLRLQQDDGRLCRPCDRHDPARRARPLKAAAGSACVPVGGRARSGSCEAARVLCAGLRPPSCCVLSSLTTGTESSMSRTVATVGFVPAMPRRRESEPRRAGVRVTQNAQRRTTANPSDQGDTDSHWRIGRAPVLGQELGRALRVAALPDA